MRLMINMMYLKFLPQQKLLPIQLPVPYKSPLVQEREVRREVLMPKSLLQRLRKPTKPNKSFLMQNLFHQLSSLGIKNDPSRDLSASDLINRISFQEPQFGMLRLPEELHCYTNFTYGSLMILLL
ncbi:uncharacterized protein LOC105420630 [Amborella trichopoda]|uniref:uncharacterized protein LOC105420630 n=1 Tax=Amborella trichopoda TaxID=13333 RepID=UPI0009BD3C04|nr:uncharacterized protein LOC105420630 [Amborella trichopoda]XP_020522810.1 uncharacterized protein LOC105420630 [Amborella trichopoda]XP_020522811.1 uncharacterized protein LOC105420630 [Amborella trichopoda]XP_020522812.1 uncharacterized protein LOC105420630 [Amborella trichopoda]|eukprot:XP_020522809.1 uncharacterized protein LOC105420630 [Amborella trichopoda]